MCGAGPRGPRGPRAHGTAGELRLEQGKLPGELGDGVAVQHGLCRPEFGLPPGPGAGDEVAALACAGRVVPGEASGYDGDLATAFGTVSATRGHGISVPARGEALRNGAAGA